MGNFRILLFVLTISGLALTTSCYHYHQDPGPVKADVRVISKFTRISVEGSMDVHLTEGPSNEIRIVGGSYLLPYIETYVKGETLVISERNNRYENDAVDIYVPCTWLSGLELSGSGSVTGSNISSDKMLIDLSGSGDIVLGITAQDILTRLSGSGDIILEGVAKYQDIEISGSGNVDARFFETLFTRLKIRGSGDINVKVLQELDVEIAGSGDVRYWGNPAKVYQNINGSGRIIKM